MEISKHKNPKRPKCSGVFHLYLAQGFVRYTILLRAQTEGAYGH